MSKTTINLKENELIIPLMDAKSIYHIYRSRAKRASVVALKGLNLRINHGEFVAVVGPSGSGKSSLMNILGGIMHPTAGHVYYDGYDITASNPEELTTFRRRMIGFVFQEGNLLYNLSAYDNVNQAMAFNGWPYEARKKRALELLETVGVLHRKNQLAYRLSGGERQRVAIARALSNQPKLIIADEPTGNVDFKTSIHILELFKELNKELGTSFLIATHSNSVAGYASRSIELKDGIFLGQHGKDIDLSKLDMSRVVVMDSDYRITIPKNVMKQLNSEEIGSLWTVAVKDGNNILITPFEQMIAETKTGDIEKIKECPVCGENNYHDVILCSNCGAKL